MPEVGPKPNVPRLQRAILRAVRASSTPLLPDDYLELINPLWSTRELRGRIERIEHVTRDAATVLIKPGYRWSGHRAGQYLRIGVDIRGVRHWRAYSLTSEPDRPDGCISITPKLVEWARSPRTWSPWATRRDRLAGRRRGRLRASRAVPDKLLFISAGSGITPIISMIRSLVRHGGLGDIVLIHSARAPEEVIFGGELRHLERRVGLKLHEQSHRDDGAATARAPRRDLSRLARARGLHLRSRPDARHARRALGARGRDRAPAHGALPAEARWRRAIGEGGEICFAKSGCEGQADGTKPILVCGEEAGLTLPFGCREGICHTCVGTLRSGRFVICATARSSGRRAWP